MSTRQKLGSKHAYRMIHQAISVVSQCGAGAWLNSWLVEISADLRETAVHQRHVCDDVLYKCTFTYIKQHFDQLSVCPSVTFVDCFKMAECIIKLLSAPGSPITLVFSYHNYVAVLMGMKNA